MLGIFPTTSHSNNQLTNIFPDSWPWKRGQKKRVATSELETVRVCLFCSSTSRSKTIIPTLNGWMLEWVCVVLVYFLLPPKKPEAPIYGGFHTWGYPHLSSFSNEGMFSQPSRDKGVPPWRAGESPSAPLSWASAAGHQPQRLSQRPELRRALARLPGDDGNRWDQLGFGEWLGRKGCWPKNFLGVQQDVMKSLEINQITWVLKFELTKKKYHQNQQDMCLK